MGTRLSYCGLLLHKTPLEHWSKQMLIQLIIRLVLRPNVEHVDKTIKFIQRYEKANKKNQHKQLSSRPEEGY